MKISTFGHETIFTEEIKTYTIEKMNKLEKYQVDIIGIDVTLEENHHQKEKDNAFLAKCLVQIPGNDLSAKAEGQTPFAAIDELESKVASQLAKVKERNVLKNTKLARSKAVLRKLFKQ